MWVSFGKERTQTFDLQIAVSRIHFGVVAGIGSFASDRAVRVTDRAPNTNVPGLSYFTRTPCAFGAGVSCTRFARCLSGLVGGGGCWKKQKKKECGAGEMGGQGGFSDSR